MTAGGWPDLLGRLRAYQESELLFAAVDLDVFTHLGDACLSAEDVAGKAGVSTRGMRMLLDALAAAGLLVKRNGNYASRPEVSLLLSGQSAENKLHAVRLMRDGREQWRGLAACVRLGGGIDTGRFAFDAESNRSFIGAMHDIGFANAVAIAGHVDFSGRRRLLDVGGGPASYSIAILQHYPYMRATVADLPLTLETSREYIARYGMQQRIDTVPVDLYADVAFDFASSYDVMLISNVLHMAGPEANEALIGKLAKHLDAGGMMIVHESFIDHAAPSEERSMFSLQMLVATDAGQCYSYEEVGGWLAAAGLIDIHPVEGVFEQPSLLVASKA
ncbi:MAG: methyltransferase [Mariprofundaceae bacterium]